MGLHIHVPGNYCKCLSQAMTVLYCYNKTCHFCPLQTVVRRTTLLFKTLKFKYFARVNLGVQHAQNDDEKNLNIARHM